MQFLRAGTLTAGDRPELYFFRAGSDEVVAGISGSALEAFQQQRRLSREEKIDVAGLHLKRQIEAGRVLDSGTLLVRDSDLQELSQRLALRTTRQP